MLIRLYQPHDAARWNEYVRGSSSATLYHSLGWKGVIERSFNQRTYYWLAEDPSGTLKGIFPLVHLKSFLFGSFMVSLPYFNYGGICADDDATQSALLEAAIQHALDEDVDHLEMRHQAPMTIQLPFKTSKVSMRLELPGCADELWKALGTKVRNQVRRPEKEGMTARIGKADELESFYTVFSKNMRDLGTPVYSRRFFRNILEVFPESTWICTVYQGRVPVASGFLVGYKGILEIPWASSLAEYNRYSPNMLLYWTALKLACDNGFKIFDFGRSTLGEGTYRFKEQWGGQPIPLYWYYWVRDGGAVPDLNPGNPKYRTAIAIWKRLPVGLSKLIGPPIVRNLP
jgi:serine/alanine adding enzyme